MAALTAERIARNEATFRAANEQISAAAADLGAFEVPFLCECADPHCTEIVRLTLVQYEQVRSDSTQFLTMLGHDGNDAHHSLVVGGNEEYAIGRKTGQAARVAAQLDERRRKQTS